MFLTLAAAAPIPQKTSDLVGRTISAAGLRGIPGLFLVSLQRADGTVFDSHDHEVKIESEDTLVFAADLKSVTFLSKFPGLKLLQWDQVEKLGVNILDRVFVQARPAARAIGFFRVNSLRTNVPESSKALPPSPQPADGPCDPPPSTPQAALSPASPLLGKTVSEVDFRKRYSATVVAVHRHNQRVAQKVQELRLESGDILLLSTSTSWVEAHAHDEAFILVSEVPDSSPRKTKKMVRAPRSPGWAPLLATRRTSLD